MEQMTFWVKLWFGTLTPKNPDPLFISLGNSLIRGNTIVKGPGQKLWASFWRGSLDMSQYFSTSSKLEISIGTGLLKSLSFISNKLLIAEGLSAITDKE